MFYEEKECSCKFSRVELLNFNIGKVAQSALAQQNYGGFFISRKVSDK